jgi:hypothetical protein
MRRNIFLKSITFGLLFLLYFTSFSQNITANYTEGQNKDSLSFLTRLDGMEQVTVTCYANGFQNSYTKQQNLSAEEIRILFMKLDELNSLIAKQSSEDNISQLQTEIINFAKQKDLLPQDFKLPVIPPLPQSFLNMQKTIPPKQVDPLDYRQSQFICNFISFGSGSAGPFIVFPRLVPILLFPIPRLFFIWSAGEGFTSCGGLVRMLGFIATGKQEGIALGFWGIGFSVFLPPTMAYGVFGYTLFVSVSAEDFIGYPFSLLYYLFKYFL